MHLMKEEIFMHNKTIGVFLTKISGKNTLTFKFDDKEANINLESNDTKAIKEVFQRIAKELCENDIELNYCVDKETIDDSKDGLFIDAAEEYIERLKSEIENLKEDEHLKIIRANQSNNN